MKRAELDAILTSMLEVAPGISDINFTCGRAPQVEAFGVLRTADVAPHITKLTSYQTERIALNIIGGEKRLLRELAVRGSCDCAYMVNERLRFRVNVFRQRGHLAVVMRKAQTEVPTLQGMGLPPIFKEIAKEKTGLVLVTGATGSGKTTTLAALLDEINRNLAVHVVTLEDPIEYLHPHKKATFNQRELGPDFDDFPSGLRAAMRQAPKVIFVGEMRDRPTVEIALTAAETGHLVLSTIHTINAGQSINRILGMFEREEEAQLRIRLSDTMRWIVSQRLLPRISGGRHLVQEIMGSNLRTREAIQIGEDDGRSYYDIIEQGQTFGWCTFDQAIVAAFEAGKITDETAMLYSTNKVKMGRYVDDAKKRLKLAEVDTSSLKLDLQALAIAK
jgi:twitching motility protein PilT